MGHCDFLDAKNFTNDKESRQDVPSAQPPVSIVLAIMSRSSKTHGLRHEGAKYSSCFVAKFNGSIIHPFFIIPPHFNLTVFRTW